jgi:hypothetical protein
MGLLQPIVRKAKNIISVFATSFLSCDVSYASCVSCAFLEKLAMGGKTVDGVVYVCGQGACGVFGDGGACSGAFDDGTLGDNTCRAAYNRKNSHKNANHGDKIYKTHSSIFAPLLLFIL